MSDMWELTTHIIIPVNGGGESEIRTRGTISHTQPFQGCRLNHSRISPNIFIN